MNCPPPRARLPDWEARLHDVEVRHAGGAWVWGRHDCAALFADAVEAVTGRDPFAVFLGASDAHFATAPGASGARLASAPGATYQRWASEREAAEALARSGFRSVRALVVDRFRPIAPAAARRGDVGYVSGVSDRLASPAVILGPVALSWRPDGRVVFSRDLIVEAFAI